MLKPFRQLLPFGTPDPEASVPAGQRVYAIGDIHGRLDLFSEMIAAIERDDEAAEPADTTVILLGDLIDRGPESAGVVTAAKRWQARRRLRIIGGNHEEMFLESLERAEVMRHFLRFGGRETALSYGMPTDVYETATVEEVRELLNGLVPQDHITFIRSFEDMIAIGDYLFVHAGILPDVPMEEQDVRDLRWIREPFLSHRQRHSHVVVHGHTITEEVDERPNRIGVDTGAYRHGRLTAIVLEGSRRRFIEVRERGGVMEISGRGTAL